MATVNLIQSKRSQSKAGLKFILSYCKRDSKTVCGDKKLIGGVNCVAESAYHEMLSTKMRYGKTDGRMFYHLVQSFSPEENITPETAHEIALKFAEREFPEYEVLVATHTDKAHIHSHFIINSVSCENGYKLRPPKDFIEQLRNASDKLCTEYGLSVLRPSIKQEKVQQMSSKEYRSAVRGESYKMRLAAAIDDAMAAARSKQDFIRLMEAEGYGVVWTDERKYITFITQDGKRCRDRSLHEKNILRRIWNMNSEYGRLSSEELKARARQSMQRAAEAKPCVTVTEPNWKGMLDTQKAQIELLSRLMNATETLTTKEELTEYMNKQLNILTENNAQCQAAVTEFQNKMRKSATEFTDSMKTVVSDTEKRVGRISDYYSNNLSMLTDTAEKYLSRIFWITVIPSAITALYYLTLLILRLI